MVAATNASISHASSHASTATAQNAAGNASDSDGADNDFMQLLSGLIAGDAPASSPANGQSTTLSDKQKQDDKVADSPTATLPQWLLPPLPLQNVAVTNNAATVTSDSADGAVDETINALTPANSSATNALLAQSLKRFGSGSKTNDTSAVANKSAADETSATPSIARDGSSPFDALMAESDKLFSKGAVQDGSALAAFAKEKDSPGTQDAASRTADSLLSGVGAQSAIPRSDASNPTSIAQYEIHSKVGSHQWVNDIGNRMSMMVSDKVHSASLQLTPDNLGPVQVKIDINDNQASVWFTADHPDTRTALEQSLPQLREMFASQGMSLTDAGVFSQHSQQQAPLLNRDPQASFSGMNDMSNEVTTTQQVLRIGLLDTYA